jgi:hypothetical protein
MPTLQFRLTAAEKEQVEALARAQGLSLSAFCRSKILADESESSTNSGIERRLAVVEEALGALREEVRSEPHASLPESLATQEDLRRLGNEVFAYVERIASEIRQEAPREEEFSLRGFARERE